MNEIIRAHEITEEEQLTAFDNASKELKEILTDKGVNKDKLIKFIINCFHLCKDEDKADLASSICFHAANQGGWNFYESIGILEIAKADYTVSYNRVLLEETKYCNCEVPDIYYCEHCGKDRCKNCGGVIESNEE